MIYIFADKRSKSTTESIIKRIFDPLERPKLYKSCDESIVLHRCIEKKGKANLYRIIAF